MLQLTMLEWRLGAEVGLAIDRERKRKEECFLLAGIEAGVMLVGSAASGYVISLPS